MVRFKGRNLNVRAQCMIRSKETGFKMLEGGSLYGESRGQGSGVAKEPLW